jgi:biotin transport system substrate-specific component
MAQALPRPVLADVLPGGLVRDVSLVVASAAFVGVVGNVAVPLPFTPVPLSLRGLDMGPDDRACVR